MGIRNQTYRRLGRNVNNRTEANRIIPGLISAISWCNGQPLPPGHPGRPGSRDRGFWEKCHEFAHEGE